MSQKETRNFRIHPNLLFDVINKQAGSLAKALLEGVCNSIDAGASKCEVTLNEEGFEIRDDGRGFENRDQIESFFECFGEPHVQGDRQYGRYRVGRGQLYSFARTLWRTGTFVMDVDIIDRGLNYKLSEASERTAGCHISGDLYQPLNHSERLAVEREFKILVEWLPIPISLNGVRVNRSIKHAHWDLETDEAYYKFSKVGPLAVYNLGAFVCEYSPYDVGTGGIVVSKQALEVNLARNAVLFTQCQTWQKVRATLDGEIRKRMQTHKGRLTDAAKVKLLRDYLAGECTYSDVCRYKILRLVNGRRLSLDELIKSIGEVPITFAPDVGDSRGDDLHEMGMMLVLTPEAWEVVGAHNPDSFRIALINAAVLHVNRHAETNPPDEPEAQSMWQTSYHNLQSVWEAFSHINIIPFEKAVKRIMDNRMIILDDDESITPLTRFAVGQLRGMLEAIREICIGLDPDWGMMIPQQLFLGESEIAEGWTDGDTFIAVNRSMIPKMYQSVGGVFALMTLLVHEACHAGEGDADSHGHDALFNERYRILMDRHAAVLGRWSATCCGILAKHLEDLGKVLPEQLSQDQGMIKKYVQALLYCYESFSSYIQPEPYEIEDIPF